MFVHTLKRSIFSSVIVLLGFTGFAQAKTTPQYCQALAYIDAGQSVVIRAHAKSNARRIAKLHDRQYICILSNADDNATWTKIKAVPFANAKEVCSSEDNQNLCSRMNNFSVKWLSKKPVGRNCRLKVTQDEGGQMVSQALGVCATGWLPSKHIRYFAD
jgi:hypothetical protein